MRNYYVPGDPLEGPERWYPIIEYEGIYEASTHGNIRRIAGGRGVRGPIPYVLKRAMNADGYLVCRLSKGGKPLTVNVHVVIARTFLGEPPKDMPEPEVDHIDEDRANPAAWNLQYLSKFANLDKRQYNSAETDEEIAALAGKVDA
jgi:hypothetical protein